MVRAGSTSDEPLAFYDFMPTACELAGVTTPDNIDGLSFVPTLLGNPNEQPSHDYLFFKYGSEAMAVRQGNWKCVYLSEDKNYELYDLSTDIGETNDIKDKHPDIVACMKQIMKSAIR